jgi:hypothetical protein
LAKIKSERDILREASPHYSALLQRHKELTARQDDLKREVGDNTLTHVTTINKSGNIEGYRVEESLGAEATRHKTWSSEAPKPQPKQRPRHARGAALLEGLIEPQSEEELSPPPLKPEWPREELYRQIAREQEDITEALKILGPAIEAARKEHSQRLGAARADDYSALVEHAVDAAREFGDAIIALFEFTNEARLDSIDRKHFRALNLHSFDIAESSHPLQRLIEDAVQKKHVGAKKMPEWKLSAPIELLHL